MQQGPLSNTSQGFDEFMNLVIDDAVEVKQATKTDPEEKRRALGGESGMPRRFVARELTFA